jgi:hypothetical protein
LEGVSDRADLLLQEFQLALLVVYCLEGEVNLVTEETPDMLLHLEFSKFIWGKTRQFK